MRLIFVVAAAEPITERCNMTHHTHSTTRRKRPRLAAIVALPALILALVAVQSVRAELAYTDGPGTDFVKCQDDAWANYNKCLMSSTFKWEKKVCDLAFEGDVARCASVYWTRLKTGK
jgi:hypothetical protein